MVERYGGLAGGIVPADDGPWVRYSDYMVMEADRDFWKVEAEAHASTGAVKVKALTFTDPGLGIVYADTIVGTYQINADGDWWINCDPIKGNGGKTSVIADYERRILSALEPAAPKGEQEAARIGDAVLAWMIKYDLLDGEQEYYVADVIAVLDDLTPLTRPSEQAVTETMVEAGAKAIVGLRFEDEGEPISDYDRDLSRAALKAAMEAGRC